MCSQDRHSFLLAATCGVNRRHTAQWGQPRAALSEGKGCYWTKCTAHCGRVQMQIGSRVSAAASRRGTGIVRCRECALACFASNTQEHFVCLRVCVCVWASWQVSACLSGRCAKWRGKQLAEASRAPWRKHIGQLRVRLCVARLRVWLIESQRQPLTALRLRTLLVITHKSLFPCIGSLAQLRPHQQST